MCHLPVLCMGPAAGGAGGAGGDHHQNSLPTKEMHWDPYGPRLGPALGEIPRCWADNGLVLPACSCVSAHSVVKEKKAPARAGQRRTPTTSSATSTTRCGTMHPSLIPAWSPGSRLASEESWACVVSCPLGMYMHGVPETTSRVGHNVSAVLFLLPSDTSRTTAARTRARARVRAPSGKPKVCGCYPMYTVQLPSWALASSPALALAHPGDCAHNTGCRQA